MSFRFESFSFALPNERVRSQGEREVVIELDRCGAVEGMEGKRVAVVEQYHGGVEEGEDEEELRISWRPEEQNFPSPFLILGMRRLQSN